MHYFFGWSMLAVICVLWATHSWLFAVLWGRGHFVDKSDGIRINWLLATFVWPLALMLTAFGILIEFLLDVTGQTLVDGLMAGAITTTSSIVGLMLTIAGCLLLVPYVRRANELERQYRQEIARVYPQFTNGR